MIQHMIYTVAGGAIGTLLRFFLIYFMPKSSLLCLTPITIVNSLGSFLLGVIIGLSEIYQGDSSVFVRYFLKLGFLGAFTTYSAFTQESFSYEEHHGIQMMIIYIILMITLCMLSYFTGGLLVKWMRHFMI